MAVFKQQENENITYPTIIQKVLKGTQHTLQKKPWLTDGLEPL